MGAALYLACSAGLTIYDYFVRWANDAEARAIYGAEFTEVARYLATADMQGPIALSAAHFRDWDRFRLDLQMQHHPPFVVWFNGPQTMLFPPPSVNPIYVFTRGAPPHTRWLDFLEIEMHGADIDVYRLRPDATPTLPDPVDAIILANFTGDSTTPQPIAKMISCEVAGRAQAGQNLSVLLLWQALMDVPGDPDYAFFVHVVDRRGYVWAQTDANGYGAVDWQPGVRVLQWLDVQLPPDLPPLEYSLQIGMEERSAGRTLAIAGSAGEGTVHVRSLRTAPAERPPSPDEFRVPNAGPVDGGGVFTLQGYSLSARVVRPGESVHASLFWQADSAPAQDYWLDVWLVDAGGIQIDLASRQPLDGDYPTSRWDAGQWVRDRFDAGLPNGLPSGLYDLFAGWRDSSGRWLLSQDVRGVSLGKLLVPAP